MDIVSALKGRYYRGRNNYEWSLCNYTIRTPKTIFELFKATKFYESVMGGAGPDTFGSRHGFNCLDAQIGFGGPMARNIPK